MVSSPAQLAAEYGVSRTLIRNRLKAGWQPGTPLKMERHGVRRQVITPSNINEIMRRWPVPGGGR